MNSRNMGMSAFAIFYFTLVLSADEHGGPDPRINTLISRVMTAEDDSLLDEIAEKLRKQRLIRIHALKPQLTRQLDLQRGDLVRNLGLSNEQDRKLQIAAKGAVLRMVKRETSKFENQLEKLVKDTRENKDRQSFVFQAFEFNQNTRIPDAFELAYQIPNSTVWTNAVKATAGNRVAEHQRWIETRQKRFARAMKYYLIMRYDRQISLSEEQISSLERLLDQSRQSMNPDEYHAMCRLRPGIIGVQYWGAARQYDRKKFQAVLTPAQRKQLQRILLHFCFDGNLEDLSGYGRNYTAKQTRLSGGTLFVDGHYGSRSFSRFETPELDANRFTVCIRVKMKSLVPGRLGRPTRPNIITADNSHRWFGMHADSDGKLFVTANNQRFQKAVGVTLEIDKWFDIVCAFNVERRTIQFWVNQKRLDEIRLPDDFKLSIKELNWMFTNYSNGRVLHGHVDEWMVLDGVISQQGFSDLSKISGFGIRNRRKDLATPEQTARLERWRQWTVDYVVHALDQKLLLNAEQHTQLKAITNKLCLDQPSFIIGNATSPSLIEITKNLRLPANLLDEQQSAELEALIVDE